MTKIFKIKSIVWKYQGKGAWYFATIPHETSIEIDDLFAHVKGGWGSLKVTAQIGNTVWSTSIFPDRKTGSYWIPLKKSVRVAEDIDDGSSINLSLEIKD